MHTVSPLWPHTVGWVPVAGAETDLRQREGYNFVVAAVDAALFSDAVVPAVDATVFEKLLTFMQLFSNFLFGSIYGEGGKDSSSILQQG